MNPWIDVETGEEIEETLPQCEEEIEGNEDKENVSVPTPPPARRPGVFQEEHYPLLPKPELVVCRNCQGTGRVAELNYVGADIVAIICDSVALV